MLLLLVLLLLRSCCCCSCCYNRAYPVQPRLSAGIHVTKVIAEHGYDAASAAASAGVSIVSSAVHVIVPPPSSSPPGAPLASTQQCKSAASAEEERLAALRSKVDKLRVIRRVAFRIFCGTPALILYVSGTRATATYRSWSSIFAQRLTTQVSDIWTMKRILRRRCLSSAPPVTRNAKVALLIPRQFRIGTRRENQHHRVVQ
jgi:hypothetical protein